jgi:hypothetical protein
MNTKQLEVENRKLIKKIAITLEELQSGKYDNIINK